MLKKPSHAGVTRIEIERAANKMKITIFTSRPGIIIGRKGPEVDKLKPELQRPRQGDPHQHQGDLKPELDAQFVAEKIASSWRSALRSAAP